MSDAKKQPSGKWRNLLYVGRDENGKRIYESFTADTKREANLLASERARELEQGIKKNRIPMELTVGEAIDKYIDERDAILAPKTAREYRGYRRNYLQGIMNVKIKRLTSDMIQREINKDARRLSPKSVHNAWALVHSALRAITPELDYKIDLPKKQKKEMRIPSNEQLIQIFEAVEGKKLELPILLGATCGLRRGEIVALDLDKDVDYERCVISVNKAMSNDTAGEWVIKSTKTVESTREVDAPAWVIEKLRDARDSGYCWMKPDGISSGFADLCKRFGFEFRFHDLRHYYASLMLSLGVPDKYAMARMGHATPNMLKNVYQHLMDDKDKEVTQILNNHFDGMQRSMQLEKCGDEEKVRKSSE